MLKKSPQPHRKFMDAATRMKRTYNREAIGIERPYATSDMYVVEVSNQFLNWVSHPNFGFPHERVRITMSTDVARVVGAYASEGLLPICRTNHMWGGACTLVGIRR